MKKLFCLIFLALGTLQAVSPDEALKRLVDGNQRFMNDNINCDAHSQRREALTNKQTPFATIVACSDSRASPDLVFDQGIGDLFVVRVAGNVVGGTELDSVLYSILVLKSNLIVVLGHQACGAVDAVLSKKADGIPSVAKYIRDGLTGTPDLNQAIHDNVIHGMNVLKQNSALAQQIKDKRIKIIGGVYSFETGKVDFFEK